MGDSSRLTRKAGTSFLFEMIIDSSYLIISFSKIVEKLVNQAMIEGFCNRPSMGLDIFLLF